MITSEIDKSFLRPLRPSAVVAYRRESTEYWRASTNSDVSATPVIGAIAPNDYLYEFPGDLTNSIGGRR